jgi:hypothetical protein
MRGADGVGDVADQDEAHHDDEVSSGRQRQALLSGGE